MKQVFESLADAATAYPDRIALCTVSGDTITYGEIPRIVDRIRALLPAPGSTVAIAGLASVASVVVDLAATLNLCRVVYLPAFFSPAQIDHVLRDADVTAVIRCDEQAISDCRVPATDITNETILTFRQSPAESEAIDRLSAYGGGAERVIYTSGTTGQPKGVRHGDRQLDFMLNALSKAVAAESTDRHLSLMPGSLLLEQVAGFFLPLMKGAQACVSTSLCGAAWTGRIDAVADAFDSYRPTTSILVPRLLNMLVQFAETSGWRPPGSLRLLAVGGAPVSPALAGRAADLGFPVRVGYGLSECCSVVLLQDRADTSAMTLGTVGYPVDGLDLSIVDGALVVRGPSVMLGYLGQPPLTEAEWNTGDLAERLDDGSFRITGRADRTLVLSSGRNLCPEWVESRIGDIPFVKQATARTNTDGELFVDAVCIEPGPQNSFFRKLSENGFSKLVETAVQDLPAYAQPAFVNFLTESGKAECVFLQASTPNEAA